jgi:sugar phosphate isomerase/epimerase
MRTDRRNLLRTAALAPLGLSAPALATVNPDDRKGQQAGPYKLALAAYSYRDFLQGPKKSMTLFDFIHRSAEMGTDGVELTEYYFEKPVTPEYLIELKRQCHLWGQSITGTPIGNNFTMPAGPERDKQIEAYNKWVDVSATLGSPTIRTFAGSTPKGLTDGDARRNVIETLEIVCDYAAKKGVYVAVENHHGVVAEPDGLLEVVKGVKSPWCGINLDCGNFYTEDPYGDLARCAPYAVTVQYKVDMFPKGKGRVDADFPRVLKILRDSGYRGFITLEYENKEDPLVAVPRHLTAMRKAMQAG